MVSYLAKISDSGTSTPSWDVDPKSPSEVPRTVLSDAPKL